MSIVSGTVGAVLGSNAQTDAANTAASAARDTSAASLAAQERIYNQQRSDFAPYQGLGTAGIDQLQNFDLMKGVGAAPSYDETYTNQLANYSEDPGTAAQKALAAKGLAQQRQARVGYSTPGADANAQAELGMKYDAVGYDKYKQQLQDRYKAQQGEFAQKRDINQNAYNQILDKVKIGQGAANSAGAAGNAYAGQVTSTNNSLGNSLAAAATNAGNAQAGLYSGLGANSASAAGLGLKALDYGSKNGWFGDGATGATGWGASSLGTTGATEGSAWGAGAGSGAAGLGAEEAAAYFM